MTGNHRLEGAKQKKTDSTCSSSARHTIRQQGQALYHTLIQTSPSHTTARIKYSHLLRQLGRITEARNLLETLKPDEIADIPLKASFFEASGALLLASGQFNEALTAYQSAIRLSPGYLNPYYGLGRTYLWLKNPQEALNAFARALQCKQQALRDGAFFQASLFWVWNGEGLAHLLAHNEDAAQESFLVAETLAQRSLKGKSREYQTWSHLGLARLGQGRYQEAEEAYQRFTAFEQIAHARGFNQELLFDIELVGTHGQIKGWRRIFEHVSNLLMNK